LWIKLGIKVKQIEDRENSSRKQESSISKNGVVDGMFELEGNGRYLRFLPVIVINWHIIYTIEIDL